MNRTTEPARRIKSIAASTAGVVLLCIALFASDQALAQSLNWTQLSPTGGPPAARISPTAVMDSSNNMIVFGGFPEGAFGLPPLFNDVWVLSNADGSGVASTWTQLTPPGAAPAGRGFHSAVYASLTNSMIVFGGDLSVGNCFDETNDVWVLAHANGTGGTPAWTQLSSQGIPPTVRDFHTAVYDGENNRMIVFGGRLECSSANAEVWVLANANGVGGTPIWAQLSPGAGAAPVPRAGHSAVYDSSNNRMIIFGGGADAGFLNDVWVLTNANGLAGAPTWIQLTPTGPLPTVRASHSAIYDPAANTMTIFGGSANIVPMNEVWVLTNANGLGGTPTWTQLQPTGGPPIPRDLHSAVFNSSSDRMTIFGGADSSALGLNDTWVLAGALTNRPAVNLSPGALTFANQVIGNTSPGQSITLTNSGTGTLTIASIAITGDFSQASNTCTSPIGTEASCSVDITFTPNTLGLRVGNLSITDNAAGSPQTISLTGAGIANICPLYDQTRALRSGATFPIKLELCDANGNDISSPSIVVHATGLVATSGFSGPVDDSGNANPDNDFRFDSTLGSTGGYIFNLSTKGVASGTYALQFTAGNDPMMHSVTFGVK